MGLPLGGAGHVWSLLPAVRLPDSDPGLPTQDFDRLLEVVQAALAKDPGTGFVFSCLSGQGRTTTAMVVAVLAFWHIQVCVACPVLPAQGRVLLSPWDPGCGRSMWRAGMVHGMVPEPVPSVLGRGLGDWQTPGKGFLRLGRGPPGRTCSLSQQLSSLRASPRWARRSS